MRAPVLTLKRARDHRRSMTLPEILLWGELRGGKLDGLRFRRQHAMGPHILDFYCPMARLAVEVDGEGHGHPNQMRHDEARTAWLSDRAVRVIRFAARDVLSEESREFVLQAIVRAAAPSTPSGSPSPMKNGGG